MPIKNFVNDSYSRDISEKVRSHQKIKRENGKFIGAFAVYGYMKSKENRNRLIPDEYAANIVKKIFALKIEGYSNLAIAKKLDEAGILSPLEYKKLQGIKLQTGFFTKVKSGWSAVAVKRILTNENYIGTLVQGKEEKINYKVKKSVVKPEKEWVRVSDAHEAIVSEEDYRIVQELLQTDTRAAAGEKKAHIYSGLLFCGDCMAPMMRRVSRYNGKEKVSFVCSTRNRGGVCTRHTIEEEALEHLVLTELQFQTALFMDKAKVLSCLENMEVDFKEVVSFNKEIERLHKEQDKYMYLRSDLYEDMKSGIITEEDFKNFSRIYEERYQELQQSVCNQEETINKLFQSADSAGINPERLKASMQVNELDRRTLISFVKRILIYEDKRVYLEFRYKEM